VQDVLVGALVGGAFTLVGGFLGAWWQTARSDSIAQAIRRAQRREDALIQLHAKSGAFAATLTNILKAAKERGATSAQYGAVNSNLVEFSELWLWESMTAVPDSSIGHAYQKLDETARGLLPGDDAGRKFQANIGAQSTVFISNLQTVVGLLADFRRAVLEEIVGLMYPEPSWLTRKLRALSGRPVSDRPAVVAMASRAEASDSARATSQ
jgi:hypothetical protein